MNVTQYVVPAVLRDALFVPRHAPGRREPAWVSPGAFKAAGLPVPEHPAQRCLTGKRAPAATWQLLVGQERNQGIPLSV